MADIYGKTLARALESTAEFVIFTLPATCQKPYIKQAQCSNVFSYRTPEVNLL